MTGIISAAIVAILGWIAKQIINLINPTEKTRLRKVLRKVQRDLDKGYSERTKYMIEKLLLENKSDNYATTIGLSSRADIYIRQNEFDKAIKLANEAISVNNSNGDAYCIIGRSYSLKGDKAKAIENFNEALEHHSRKREDIYFNRGCEYWVLGEYDKSIDDFSAMLKIRPKSFDGLTYRAAGYARKKDNEAAMTDITNALKIKSYGDWRIFIGRLYIEIEDNEVKIANITKKLWKIKKYALWYALRGRLYIEMANNEAAIADLNMAIKIDKKNAVYLFARGYAYYNIKEYRRAIEDYTKAIEIDNNNAKYYKDRAHANNEIEEYEQAIEDFTKALDIDNNNAECYAGRGRAYERKEKYNLAIADFSTALNIEPDNKAACKLLRALAYFQNKEYERALEDITALEGKEGIDLTEIYYLFALMHKKEGKNELAIKYLTKALEKKENADYYHERGDVYYGEGEYDLALKDMSSAIDIDSNYAKFFVHRAIVYKKRGELGLAVKDINSALKIDSNEGAYIIECLLGN